MEGNVERKAPNGSTERQVGFLAGRIDGLTAAINDLSKRFDEHIREHHRSWSWIAPTLVSLATLVVLIVYYFRG